MAIIRPIREITDEEWNTMFPEWSSTQNNNQTGIAHPIPPHPPGPIGPLDPWWPFPW
jgi:hypothetical protein